MKQLFIQLADKHSEEIKAAVVGAGGLTALFTSLDIILKCAVSAVILLYYGIKIHAHYKNKSNQKSDD